MASDDRPRLIITEDDLEIPPGRPEQRAHSPLPPVDGATPAGRPASVVAGGGVAPAAVGFARTLQGRNTIAALCGTVLGWAVCELTDLGLWTAYSALGDDIRTGVYTGVVGFFFAVVYAGWEDLTARSREGTLIAVRNAGPVGFGLAFAAGFVAAIVYRHFVVQIARSLTLADVLHLQDNVKLYLCRALAWALFGAGMGLAVAGGIRAKVVNGVLGGAVGGALGGLVFHWISFNISSEATARLVGLAVVAACIGLAIGVVEKARREAWAYVTAGPLTGKEFIIYGPGFTLGSSPKCDLTLIKDSAVAHYHATIREADGSRVLEAAAGCRVTVNGAPVMRQRLRSGDAICVGAAEITYSERV